jgi:hypothetical protein
MLLDMVGMKFGGVTAVWRRQTELVEVVGFVRKRKKRMLKAKMVKACLNIGPEVEITTLLILKKRNDFLQISRVRIIINL